MKVKKIRNPIPTGEDFCEVCGLPYAELHEIFYGNPRSQYSKQDELQIRLCGDHHRTGVGSVHKNPKSAFAVKLKQRGQIMFEQKLMDQGMDQEDVRQRFIDRYGRNYL